MSSVTWQAPAAGANASTERSSLAEKTKVQSISNELSHIDDRDGKSAADIFNMVDKDGDGVITPEEFQRIYEAIKDEVKYEHVKETELEKQRNRAVRRAKVSCCFIGILLLLVTVLLSGTGYIVYTLIELTKEMHIKEVHHTTTTTVHNSTTIEHHEHHTHHLSENQTRVVESLGEPEQPPVAVHTTAVSTMPAPALTSPSGDVVQTATTHSMGDIAELPYMTEDDLQRLKYISYQDALGNSISAQLMHWKYVGRTLAGKQEQDTHSFEQPFGHSTVDEEAELMKLNAEVGDGEPNATSIYDLQDDFLESDDYAEMHGFANATENETLYWAYRGEIDEHYYELQEEGYGNRTHHDLATDQIKHSEPALEFDLSNGDIGFVQNGAYMIMGKADGLLYYNAMTSTLNMSGNGELTPHLLSFHTKTCMANRCPWRMCNTHTAAGEAREVSNQQPIS